MVKLNKDLREELKGLYENVSIDDEDELDFHMELAERFTLEDIKKYLPENYEYTKEFWEDHGLV